MLARLTALAVLLLVAAAAPAAAKPKKVRITVTGPEGERTLDAADLRFVYFRTRYRTTRAPAEESPNRERTTILNDRDDCDCLRLADYSRIRFSALREIEVHAGAGQPVASVRAVWRAGKTREFPATALYGGDGLAPPLFMVTYDGVAHEFPLVLPADGGAWPATMLVRALLLPPPPAPPAKKGSHSH